MESRKHLQYQFNFKVKYKKLNKNTIKSNCCRRRLNKIQNNRKNSEPKFNRRYKSKLYLVNI